MKKIVYLFIAFVLISCSGSHDHGYDSDYVTQENYPDGTYCAEVNYHNPNTGTNSTYTLEVEVESNHVTTIYWRNGGWLDEDHFSPEELDDEGMCSFISDKGYEYTIEIIGQNCEILDSEDQIKQRNIPKYTFKEAVQLLGFSEREINECRSYTEGDVLSENDLYILSEDLKSIREYLQAVDYYTSDTYSNSSASESNYNRMQQEISEGYVVSIERKSAYGVTSQIVYISKNNVLYALEVMGERECTMGTAKFDENDNGWQMIYIKQNPNEQSYKGYQMRILDRAY